MPELDSGCLPCQNCPMKRLLLIGLFALAGCSPVLNREYMDAGARNFTPSHLAETPEVFKDKLFVLGGVIVETKLAEQGSQIEALFVPVDRYGYLKSASRYQGRFIAFYPKSQGILDPLIYKKGREITVAADFAGARPGKIDQMEYTFPVFNIRQIYLWEERDYLPLSYYYPYPYAYPSWNPWCYDAWGRPYPCPPYWGPPLW